jgi:predicted HNH restriction endonuclease
LSQLLKKDKKYVANILEQISYFDPTDEKYNEPTYYRKILLEDIFQWYWNNKEIARANFEIFLNIINTDTSLNFNSDLKDIIKENQKIFKEEGSIINLNIKLRKRSTELLNKARIYFRRQNNEGKLRCSICGYVKPNYIEREIVHIHHMEPLKDVPAEGIDILFEDAIKKMIPLCPTCHSIIHAKENNNLTIDQVIEHMQK